MKSGRYYKGHYVSSEGEGTEPIYGHNIQRVTKYTRQLAESKRVEGDCCHWWVGLAYSSGVIAAGGVRRDGKRYREGQGDNENSKN